ncbi:GNAT family N-acetyltransferase [Acrocarpospora catenulata]|uniref:GNAT family N-acetyltransferase n=1 Tax=Acrocarpospora catenulata TaxID=2836182 RepID=UPI001BD991DC|nr:GNAT family N-acetyltransferase [Acrocarpospora catenulata]
MDVTTWYLEQTSPADLRKSRPPRVPVEIVRAELPSPEFSRFLYTAVGGGWHWTDRLTWTPEQWSDWLAAEVETWVAYERGTPAGYAQLQGQPEGNVEIAYFGLLPYAMGKGIGGHLLAFALERAWDLAERLPRETTRRVWVHTCSLDGPAALPNYQARGFSVYDTVTERAG